MKDAGERAGDHANGSPVALPRRGILKKGILGGALLIVAGALPIGLRSPRPGPPPRQPLRLFSPAEHAIFSAVAARVAPGEGAGPEWPTAEALDCAGQADLLLSRCHPQVGREFRQLLRLFDNGLTSLLSGFGPTPFSRLAPADQDRRLDAWRRSRLPLFRTGFQAMVRLANAIYHSAPEVYAHLGYPGPPEVPSF